MAIFVSLTKIEFRPFAWKKNKQSIKKSARNRIRRTFFWFCETKPLWRHGRNRGGSATLTLINIQIRQPTHTSRWLPTWPPYEFIWETFFKSVRDVGGRRESESCRYWCVVCRGGQSAIQNGRHIKFLGNIYSIFNYLHLISLQNFKSDWHPSKTPRSKTTDVGWGDAKSFVEMIYWPQCFLK